MWRMKMHVDKEKKDGHELNSAIIAKSYRALSHFADHLQSPK